jgi:hypothetical protein
VQFKALAHQYPNHYAFRRIDINRPGVVGIDWASRATIRVTEHSALGHLWPRQVPDRSILWNVARHRVDWISLLYPRFAG